MAAPVADKNAGLMAVGVIEGASTIVASVKSDFTFWAILGVCDVPPDSMTCHLVSQCNVRTEVSVPRQRPADLGLLS